MLDFLEELVWQVAYFVKMGMAARVGGHCDKPVILLRLSFLRLLRVNDPNQSCANKAADKGGSVHEQ